MGSYDTGFPFLFFNFGILAHGMLILRIRAFEEGSLSFYRSLPIPLITRFLQYALAYAILLIPEGITLAMLTPIHLHYTDALLFLVCGYGSLMLLHSISFLQGYRMKEFLKILLLIFGLQYIILLGIGLTALSLLLFPLAMIFFLQGYYRFEQTTDT